MRGRHVDNARREQAHIDPIVTLVDKQVLEFDGHTARIIQATRPCVYTPMGVGEPTMRQHLERIWLRWDWTDRRQFIEDVVERVTNPSNPNASFDVGVFGRHWRMAIDDFTHHTTTEWDAQGFLTWFDDTLEATNQDVSRRLRETIEMDERWTLEVQELKGHPKRKQLETRTFMCCIRNLHIKLAHAIACLVYEGV